METIFESHIEQLKGLQTLFFRDFWQEIDWDDRMIGITGARGVGKSTLMLQYIKQQYGNSRKALYVSMDHLHITQQRIYDIAQEFSQYGGEHLFIDEIHRYENWSQELKSIYDTFKKLKVVFSGSSALHLHQGQADLSRRAVIYKMRGLSFREFIELETDHKFEKYSLSHLLQHHEDISATICEKLKPLPLFDEYLKHGYYPFYLQSKKTYLQKLLQVINLSMEIDLPNIHHIDLKSVQKLRKLLHTLSSDVPFQPNIEKLCAALESSRPTVLNFLKYLEDAQLIHLLKSPTKAYSAMTKPEKIYLQNTNLAHAITYDGANAGTMREIFFYNQMSKDHKVNYSDMGDFLINEKYTFEVGGKNKTFRQVKGLKHGFLAVDGIEHGNKNKIPLWLFGFLY